MDHKREVNKEKGETFAINHGLKFFETSAKENINVEKAFTEITHDILNKVLHTKFYTIYDTLFKNYFPIYYLVR